MTRTFVCSLTVLLCLIFSIELGVAQYSEACVRWCTMNHGAGMPVNDSVGLNQCFHTVPICTGQSFHGIPAPKGQARKGSAAARPTAAKAGAATSAAWAAACGSDFGKFCQGIKQGGGRLIACVMARKSELSPACQQMVTRQRS
jgi:hypothetical protein